jgi:GAF domain-containing protein
VSDPGDEDATVRALGVLVAVAHRLDAAARLERPDEQPLLNALAQTASVVLEVQAASIALYQPESDRLVFVAAAGPAAGEVVGLGIDATSGIAGYAFSSSQPLAVAEATSDPRFDRTVAEATGYVPGSILATPLIDAAGTIGVLEALDRRGGSFTLRDLDVAGALAREATIIARDGRLERDASTLLRGAIEAWSAAALGGGDGSLLDADGIDALVAAATAAVPTDPDDPIWRLADRIAQVRAVDPESVELVIDWLDALIRRRGGSTDRPVWKSAG